MKILLAPNKLTALLVSLALVGCGGASSNVGSNGVGSLPINNPSPNPTTPPAQPKSVLRLVMSLVTPRVIDVVISSFRLSLYSGPGNLGTLVAGPLNVSRGTGPTQTIDWNDLPVGTYSFYLELLDSSGNLRGTFLQLVELSADQTLSITDPAWTDATQPPPQTSPLPPGSQPQSKITALTGTTSAMVLDSVRQRVYISNTTANRVEVYDLNSRALLDPIPCGNNPQGIDLSADGRYLVICPSAESKIQMADLSVSPPTLLTIPMPAATRGTNQPRYVACASNGKALFGCVFNGSGWTDLWELDLQSRIIIRRADGNIVRDPLYLKASGDRNTVALAEGDVSNGPVFLYSAQTNTFSSRKNTSNFQRFAAADSTGSRFLFASSFFNSQLRRFAASPTSPVDFAFNQTNRFAFAAPAGRAQVDWIDEHRFLLIRAFDLSANPQQLISTSDGRRFLATTANGLEDVRLPANFPPQVEPLQTLSVPLGGDGSITLQAYDPEGDAIHFDALSLPNGAQLDSNTGVLRFRPSAAQTSGISQATISVNDGVAATNVTVPLQVLAQDSATTVLPIAGDLRELHFDASSGLLYATNRSKNRVERIRLQGFAHLSPIPVGSQPQGFDRVPGLSQLLVCCNSGEFMDVVDTGLQSVNRSILVPSDPNANHRTYSVAVSSSGKVLVGLDAAGNDNTVLREINLNGDSVTQRTDLGRLAEPLVLRPSGDRNRIAVMETGLTSSEGFLLDASLGNLQALVSNRRFPQDLAGNRDGSRWLIGEGPSLFSPGNTNLGTVTPTQQFFTWMGDLAYGHTGTAALNLFNLSNFSAGLLVTLPVSATGKMCLNDQQNSLFVVCQGGLAVVRLPIR